MDVYTSQKKKKPAQMRQLLGVASFFLVFQVEKQGI